MSLTRRQSDLLAFLKLEIESGRGVPSFEEMKVALGLNSKSGVHRLIDALDERGFIRRIPNRARCIELVENPTLNIARNLRTYTNLTIAQEAKRRGLVLGKIVESIGAGGLKRTFEEVVR